MLKKNFILFTAYLFLNIIFSALIHRDVLFNGLNYGRHWDWTFFSFIEMYQNYVNSFFSVIGNNALGSYGTIGVGDFIVKQGIIVLHSIFSTVPLTVLNKIVVFVIFPAISSLGIWNLVMTVGKYSEKKSAYYLFLIAFFSNILYTLSLPIIYDLHGGAINRQISTMALPFIFAYIYRVFKESKSFRYLVWCGALSIFLDISNIFYISTIIGLAILLKPTSVYAKIKDLLAYVISFLLVSTYWLHNIFFSQAINPVQILSERRLDIATLRAYSSPFKQLLFLSSSPHDLVETVFRNNYLIYIPAAVAIFIILWQIHRIIKSKQKNTNRDILFALITYAFTSVLVSGTYSVGNIYMFLYSFPFLGFIQNSVRFSPNLNLSLIFCLLIVLSQRPYSKNKILLSIISATLVIWISFLIYNGNIIHRTFTKTTKNSPKMPYVMNNEIGSLYAPDSSLLERLEGDKFIGNVIPIPSLTSPIFISNVYPQTSQGSDTEIEYDKGILQTAGNTTQAEKFIQSQFRLRSPSVPLQAMNVQYVWLNGNYMLEDRVNLKSHFSKKWLSKIVNMLPSPLERDSQLNTLFRVTNDSLTPVIYSSNSEITSGSPTKMVTEYKKISETKYLVVVHKPEKKFDLVLSKQFYAGWKASVVYGAITHNLGTKINTDSYKISEPNLTTQANIPELTDYIDKGYISSLGDGKVKVTQYHRHKNGLRVLVKEDRTKIDYISKMFRNSIQNNNLFSPNPRLKTVNIPDSMHKTFYGYANLWSIDMGKVCTAQTCSENGDLTIIIEYEPQNTYRLALIVSTISFSACLLIFLNFNRKYNS